MCSLNTSSFYSFHSKDNKIVDIFSIHPIFSLPLFITCSFNISTFYNSFHSKDNSQSNLLTSFPLFQSLLEPLLSCVFQHFAILQIFPQQVQFLTKSVHIFSILPIFPQALFSLLLLQHRHFTILSTARTIFNQIYQHLLHHSNIYPGPFYHVFSTVRHFTISRTIFIQICTHVLHSSNLSPCVFQHFVFSNNYMHIKDNFHLNLSSTSPFFQSFPRPFLSCVLSTFRNFTTVSAAMTIFSQIKPQALLSWLLSTSHHFITLSIARQFSINSHPNQIHLVPL